MSEGKLVRLTNDLIVNPAHVASVSWDWGHSYSALIIMMADGTRHSIRHDHSYGSVDCYAIERKLLDA